MTDSRLGLHRRYRPRSFAEMTGQRHVSTILRRAVVNGSVPQQILFAGGSGLGKTTVARICAAAIMCETDLSQRDDGDVCGHCATCKDVLEIGGHHPDLIEFDAASHGGKDDVREIASRAALSPMRARWKVYIIDEAHGLSGPGGEAFLKLLEEPPPHVVFMLATTDPHKMLSTNRGRCMELELLRPRDADIAANLQRVATGEGWTLEERVADALVQATSPELGVRGTLMSLEKLAGPLNRHETISDDLLAELLGVPPTHQVSVIFERIRSADRSGALDAVVDLRQRVSDTALRRSLLRRLRQDFLDASANRSDTPADVALLRYETFAGARPGEVGTEVAVARLASAHLVPDAEALRSHVEGAEGVIKRLQDLLAAAESVGLAQVRTRTEEVPAPADPSPDLTLTAPTPAVQAKVEAVPAQEDPPREAPSLPTPVQAPPATAQPAPLQAPPVVAQPVSTEASQSAPEPTRSERPVQKPPAPPKRSEPAPEKRPRNSRPTTPHVVPDDVDLGWGMPVPTVSPAAPGEPKSNRTKKTAAPERSAKRPPRQSNTAGKTAPEKQSRPPERPPVEPAPPAEDSRSLFLNAVSETNPAAARFLAQGCRFLEEDGTLYFLIPASRVEAVRAEGIGRIVSAATRSSGVKVKLRPYEE